MSESRTTTGLPVPPWTERETELRATIERLLETNERLRSKLKIARNQRDVARRSRDLWRHRAMQGSARRRQRERGALAA